jgi:hypothetical protein
MFHEVRNAECDIAIHVTDVSTTDTSVNIYYGIWTLIYTENAGNWEIIELDFRLSRR